MTLHPDAAKLVNEGRAERFSGASAGRGERAWREAAAEERRDTGFLVPVAVGVTVWTKGPTEDEDGWASQDRRMAGVVLSVYGAGGEEMVKVYNSYARNPARRFPRWRMTDLDLYMTTENDVHVLSRHVRRLCGLLGCGSGPLDKWEGTTLDDARRLCAVVLTRGKATE